MSCFSNYEVNTCNKTSENREKFFRTTPHIFCKSWFSWPLMERAKDRAKDEYLAVMFMMNSDPNRFGDLVRGIENDYTRGSDTYPATLSAAYDYLVNYRTAPKPNNNDPDPELSFYNEDGTGRGQGRGGRDGGHGGGRGRGTQGGRGSGRGDGASGGGGQPPTIQEQVHNQAGHGNEDEDAAYLVDNLDNVEDYSPLVYSLYLESDFVGYTRNYQQSNNKIKTILLDSCSTVNLIADKGLLRDIHRVATTMNIRCIRTRKNLLFDRKYVVRYHGIFLFFTWFSTSSKSY